MCIRDRYSHITQTRIKKTAWPCTVYRCSTTGEESLSEVAVGKRGNGRFRSRYHYAVDENVRRLDIRFVEGRLRWLCRPRCTESVEPEEHSRRFMKL